MNHFLCEQFVMFCCQLCKVEQHLLVTLDLLCLTCAALLLQSKQYGPCTMVRLRELKKQLQEDKDPNKVRLLNGTSNPECIEYLTVNCLVYMMASVFGRESL